MDYHSQTSLKHYLLKAFHQKATLHSKSGISVNPFVAEFASWYERIRNAMEYRDEEVILRAAIERIIKRRLILSNDPHDIAEALVRELIWARYFSDGSITEQSTQKIANTIGTYLELGNILIQQRQISETKISEWIHELMSSEIEHLLNPNPEKEAMSNFMFHVLKNNIILEKEAEETRDAQVFIAVRRAYGRDDTALLRYQLFLQFFGQLNESSLQHIASQFSKGYTTITQQLFYPLRHKIYLEIKRYTPAFLILEDILRSEHGTIDHLQEDEEELMQKVYVICERKYKSISAKVQRAIIRSVIFILLSKAVFALAVESTYENIVYGKVLWLSMTINIVSPPLLMIIASMFIKTPSDRNTIIIFNYIKTLLEDPQPQLGEPITLRHAKPKKQPILNAIFTFLWLTTFFLSFGAVLFVLSKLQFNFMSQAVFIFFLAIVSFLSYRIYRTAHIYTVEETQSFFSPLVDFLFIPIVQAGRYLTEGITQINVILFILDFIIETPFKGLFAFAEQWFIFLRAKREELE